MQKPLLVRSTLTGQVYVVTRYKITGTDTAQGIIAQRKHEVTDQFKQIGEQLLTEILPKVSYLSGGTGPRRTGVFKEYHIKAICEAFAQAFK